MTIQTQNMQQMQSMQQMHRGQGQGNGGGHGMGRIMRNLSPDQRQEISQTLQSMSQDERKSAMQQIKKLDISNMNSDQLFQSVMNILNPATQQNVITATSIDTYA